MSLLRDVFGPMPTTQTVVARLKLMAIIIGAWLVFAALVVGLPYVARR